MSTASFHETAPTIVAPSRSIVRRFAWKEYRVQRGLWLAVAVMGIVVQCVVNMLNPPQFDHAMLLFCVALASAVLYAVGATATTFSLEQEEETYGFLSGLPATWWPLFVGKLTVAATSAIGLAGTLTVAGWIVCGLKLPDARDTAGALSLFGVAILEALAWGTLFSLLTKRPLTAAVLTLVVGATATHLAVNYSSSNVAAGIDPSSYVDAIPLRLAIVAIVLASSAWVARRWLVVGARPATGGATGTAWFPASAARVGQRISWVSMGATGGARRRMLARLLWQTWRDSWKRLPIPIVVACVSVVTTGLFVQLIDNTVLDLAVASTVFFAPALYGALAFSADKRRGSYRFLAEHAARPRYVWLARHVVWLGAVIVLTAAVSAMGLATFAAALQWGAARAIENYIRWGEWGYPDVSQLMFELARDARFIIQAIGLATCGVLVAYGIGQSLSLSMRSEIMAAFVAMLLAVVLAAWVAVLFVWQLAGWMFLLPLFAGLMLATWLRAPAWITERRSWRAWLWPALAIGAPLILIGLMLPVVRMAQLPIHVRSDDRNSMVAQTAITNQLDWYRHGDSPEARETADMYLRATDLLHSWENHDLFERWNKPEYMATVGGEMGGDAFGGESVGGIDVSKIPAEERAAFREATRQEMELQRKALAAAIELATKASLRPTCRFKFDIRQARPDRPAWRRDLGLHSIPNYARLVELLNAVLLTDGSSDEAFTPKLTALRISAHIRSGQPSAIFVDQMKREQEILEQIGQWAFHDDRTEEQLRAALEALGEYFSAANLNPDEYLLADHLLVRDVLTGDAYPLALAEDPESKPAYLAFLANEMSWERERALRALDLITLQNIANVSKLVQSLATHELPEFGNWLVRRWMRPSWVGIDWPEMWALQQPAAATSYLARFEYQARVKMDEVNRAICDAEVFRRATILKIALARYRLAHNDYPESLAQLVPEYLERELLDPYSFRPFQYAPHGLDLPLETLIVNQTRQRYGPNTPLFWSVGVGNSRLEKRKETRRIENAADPTRDLVETTDTFYALTGNEQPWWNEPVFVFPLPK